MKRWVDVDPLDWYYRDILDISRLKQSLNGGDIVNGTAYDVFEPNQERLIKRFVTVEGQKEFLLPTYKYDSGNPIYVIVNGVEALPEKVEDGKVTMSNPLSPGIEVVCIAYGKPAIKRIGCIDSPYEGCGDPRPPSAILKYKSTYFFSLSYPPETCTVLGIKLKRKIVNIAVGENAEDKIRDTIGDQRDIFVINDGKVYLPGMYNGFPAVIGYNATIDGVNRSTSETVIVKANCVHYNDRFFPNIRLTRGGFFGLMCNLLINLQNRFTDREFAYNPAPQRHIQDGAELDAWWYKDAVRTLLDEKFMDGCYVFPLYADDKFEGEECLTRAEAVTYLNRFIEWATEKYR